HVHYGVVEHMPDVQRSCYIRRRNNKRTHRPVRISIGSVKIFVDPPLRPMRLKSLWFIDFMKFHREISGYRIGSHRNAGLPARQVWFNDLIPQRAVCQTMLAADPRVQMLLSSSTVEHSAVNRRVVGSNPT